MHGRRIPSSVLLVLVGVLSVPASSTAQEPAPSDTVRGTLLDRIQEEDRRFYSEELFQVDPGLRDSVLHTLGDLGIEEYLKESRSRRPFLEFSLDPAGRLISYNRVEALVAGLRAHLRFRSGVTLEAEAAYASAPRQLRHLEMLRVPWRVGGRRTVLELQFADRVVPYGSNRPVANGLRALVGSADEQDYLRQREGRATMAVHLKSHRSLLLGYRGARETSVPARSDFGLFGNSRLLSFNAPVKEGYDRGVVLGLSWGSLSETRNQLDVRHRISGGNLGGEFTYARTETYLATRRYLPGNHELILDAGWVEAAGSPPVQRLADVGGLSTVRGFDRRTSIGRRSLTFRAEILLPYNLLGFTPLRGLWLQAVPWADAGRVWDGASEAWLTSAGLGIQRYLGPFGSGAFLRLDAAVPLGPDRADDVRFYLRFSRGLF